VIAPLSETVEGDEHKTQVLPSIESAETSAIDDLRHVDGLPVAMIDPPDRCLFAFSFDYAPMENCAVLPDLKEQQGTADTAALLLIPPQWARRANDGTSTSSA
jgi:hypothetical protein